MDAMETLRGNVKHLRIRAGWTQQQLAERAGMDYNYFQKIESGRWGGLRLSTVEALAMALGVELWELFVPRKIGEAAARARPRKKSPRGRGVRE